jgi:hypothetical protein
MKINAKPQPEQSMQEKQIRTALNAHWHASAVGDANAEHDIYEDDASVITRSRASESSGEGICRPCGVIIPASRPASRSYYGVPQRQGRPRNIVFRGSLRGAGLAEAMGSADRVTPL